MTHVKRIRRMIMDENGKIVPVEIKGLLISQ
jgi:hypothetical protein